MHINTIAVSGNLTRDPVLKWVAEDGSRGITQLSLANTRSFKTEAGEWQEETSFFDIDVFGPFALTCKRKLRKRDLVVVQGRLDQQTWETEDGSKRSKLQIVADRIDGEGLFRHKNEDASLVDAEPAPAEQTEMAVA